MSEEYQKIELIRLHEDELRQRLQHYLHVGDKQLLRIKAITVNECVFSAANLSALIALLRRFFQIENFYGLYRIELWENSFRPEAINHCPIKLFIALAQHAVIHENCFIHEDLQKFSNYSLRFSDYEKRYIYDEVLIFLKQIDAAKRRLLAEGVLSFPADPSKRSLKTSYRKIQTEIEASLVHPDYHGWGDTDKYNAALQNAIRFSYDQLKDMLRKMYAQEPRLYEILTCYELSQSPKTYLTSAFVEVFVAPEVHEEAPVIIDFGDFQDDISVYEFKRDIAQKRNLRIGYALPSKFVVGEKAQRQYTRMFLAFFDHGKELLEGATAVAFFKMMCGKFMSHIATAPEAVKLILEKQIKRGFWNAVMKCFDEALKANIMNEGKLVTFYGICISEMYSIVSKEEEKEVEEVESLIRPRLQALKQRFQSAKASLPEASAEKDVAAGARAVTEDDHEKAAGVGLDSKAEEKVAVARAAEEDVIEKREQSAPRSKARKKEVVAGTKINDDAEKARSAAREARRSSSSPVAPPDSVAFTLRRSSRNPAPPIRTLIN